MSIPVQTESTFVDREALTEQFCDQLEALEYETDSHVVRMVFSVRRGAIRLPTARIAIPLAGLSKMSTALTELLAQLAAQGIIRTVQLAPGSEARN
jgi:hypothetical protein